MSDKKRVYEYEGKKVDAAWDQRLCHPLWESARGPMASCSRAGVTPGASRIGERPDYVVRRGQALSRRVP